jgi:3-dehydroquinate dehydratase-2
MARLLLLHGPNLNLLGKREPQLYGSHDLAHINQTLLKVAQQLGHQLDHFQTNAEHELVEKIHQALTNQTDFILINPAAFTHTSLALRDALLATAIPFIEIHLSNTYAREPFRQHSYLADIAQGVLTGLGDYGYELALLAADNFLKNKPNLSN